MTSKHGAPAARRILLAKFVVTQTAFPHAIGAQRVPTPVTDVTPSGCYFVQPVMLEGASERLDGRPRWVPFRANLYPVVLDPDGSPWREANLYLLLRFEEEVSPDMETLGGIADDLAAYRRFVIEYGLDWTEFPSSKLLRPTYRYNAHLRLLVRAGEISTFTARRRMSRVIGFYRDIVNRQLIRPAHDPWKESKRVITFRDEYGKPMAKQIRTTDVSIRVPAHEDPYEDIIEDGGRLRPLPANEQQWLAQALVACANPEMNLIFLLAWSTGARIQTVLTFRLRHVCAAVSPLSDEVRVPVGPGTGIDTKGDKRHVLHIPAPLYERLRVYAMSRRAERRRARTLTGSHSDQYLFLSVRGAPLYQSKDDSASYDPGATLHHKKRGQAVRTFIKERVLPAIRVHKDAERFHFRYHDLRATYGMNLTDAQLDLVKQGTISLHQAREYVRIRMGHSSATVTDRYLNFRQYQAQVRGARAQYEKHLQALAESVDEGLRRA